LQIPKAVLGSERIKAASKMLVKSTPGVGMGLAEETGFEIKVPSRNSRIQGYVTIHPGPGLI